LVLGMYILQNISPFSSLCNSGNVDSLISLNACANFLEAIENAYCANPYHNNIHATDVMQFLSVILQSPILKKRFTSLECLTLLMAAAGHDVGHNGKNNDYHKKTRSELCQKYNESYLENHHISQMMTLLEDSKSSSNWLKNIPEKDQERMKTWIRYCILGTDMTNYHATIKRELKEKLVTLCDTERTWLEEDKLIVARSCVHFADIGNPCREDNVAREWGKLVVTEFYEQGDVMRQLGLEISPGCDRYEGIKSESNKPKFDFNTMCFEPMLDLLTPLVPQLKSEALAIYQKNKSKI